MSLKTILASEGISKESYRRRSYVNLGEVETPRAGLLADVEIEGFIFEAGRDSEFDITTIDFVDEAENQRSMREREFLRFTGLREAQIMEMIWDEFQAQNEARYEDMYR